MRHARMSICSTLYAILLGISAEIWRGYPLRSQNLLQLCVSLHVVLFLNPTFRAQFIYWKFKIIELFSPHFPQAMIALGHIDRDWRLCILPFECRYKILTKKLNTWLWNVVFRMIWTRFVWKSPKRIWQSSWGFSMNSVPSGTESTKKAIDINQWDIT